MKRGNQIAVIWLLAATALSAFAARQTAPGTVTISGRVMDFKGQPIEGASVELKDSRFETVAKAVSGKDGRYSLAASKGQYMALLAVKDYQVKFLEYWAWAVPAERDLEINPRFDRLEVYAINAWRPQGAYPSYQIYFRPMSLTRVIKKVTEAGGMENLGKFPLLDIAPELAAKDILVRIDEQPVKILKVNKVREAAGPNQDMIGYVIQTDLPGKETAAEYSLITITLTDVETNEMGEGAVFFRQAQNMIGAGRTERPYLDVALRTEKWINGTAISSPDGLTWPADPQDLQSVNATLYAGNPGVVLFYLELYASTGDKGHLKKACAGADRLIAGLAKEKTMGLYEGAAGIGFALEGTYKASAQEKYRRAFLRCLDLIRQSARKAGQGLEWEGTTDIISGGAGIGLFLLYSSSELADNSLLDLACKAGDRLIELGKPENGGLKWAMDEKFPRLMPNFSHGTAGIAYFLATLYEKTKQEAYLDAALAGAKYLLSIAKTDGDACLIFHNEPDGKDLYYLGWCHGPVGTARLFYRLSKATGKASWLDWVKRSANGIMESGIPEKQTPGFWNNAGICCGLAGGGGFFFSLYETNRDRKYLDFCERITDKLLTTASADGTGLKWIQAEHRTRPELLVAQTGLMQGAAGIGLFLLHYDAFESGRRIKIILPDTPF